MNFIRNYHTHTKRCGHAVGEDEEYVIEAIKMGIKVLGFSDHVMIPNVSELNVRAEYSQMDDYFQSIKYLKGKYKDQIEILLGFETEYSKDYEEYYAYLLKEKVDYMLLGQHNFFENNKVIYYTVQDGPIEDTIHYVDDVIDGIHSGLFKYLCHPDLYLYSQKTWNKDLEREGRRILKACEEANFPIELNICGMRKTGYDGEHYSYPNKNFFKMVKDYKVKVVLGIDAHDPRNFNKEDVERALKFADECGFKVDLDYKI